MQFSNTSKLVRMENVAGRIFPMEIGNRYQYELTYETTSKSTYSNSVDEDTSKYSCEITKKYNAEVFHKDLTGSAFLAVCSMQTTYKINTAANSTISTNELFFDGLGAWLSVDPVSPRERLVGKDHVYTLKAVSLAQ